jgi:hypothetical protein
MLAGFPADKRAALLAKLYQTHDELTARAEQARAKEQSSVKAGARDPGMLAVAAQLLLAAGWTVTPPD